MIKVLNPFCHEFREIVNYIDETIMGKSFKMTLRKECRRIIVRKFVKDEKAFRSSKSGVDNKTLTNTLHYHEGDVLSIMYAVLTSVSSTYPGDDIRTILQKDY